ncbi:MAG: hypothetical protein ACLFP4_10815 [Spirochaetales bacterium]
MSKSLFRVSRRLVVVAIVVALAVVFLSACGKPDPREARAEFTAELVELSPWRTEIVDQLKGAEFFHEVHVTSGYQFGWNEHGNFTVQRWSVGHPEGSIHEFETEMLETEDGVVVMVLGGTEIVPFSTFTPDGLVVDASLEVAKDVSAITKSWGAAVITLAAYDTVEWPTGIVRPISLDSSERDAWLSSFQQELIVRAEKKAADDAAAAAAEPEDSVAGSPRPATDWDEILDDYEEAIDLVVAASKKLEDNSTDVTAMNELNRANGIMFDLQSKLQGASDELSASQAARLSRIAMKAARGAL